MTRAYLLDFKGVWELQANMNRLISEVIEVRDVFDEANPDAPGAQAEGAD